MLSASLEIISSAVGIAHILLRYIFLLPVKTSLVATFFFNISFGFQTDFLHITVLLLAFFKNWPRLFSVPVFLSKSV